MSNDIAKWVFVKENSNPPLYFADEEYDTQKLSEALIEDMRYFAGSHTGYTLTPISLKQLFEARLADK